LFCSIFFNGCWAILTADNVGRQCWPVCRELLSCSAFLWRYVPFLPRDAAMLARSWES